MSDHPALHFEIDSAHPSLPGHFPGQPVVPGVLILDRVVDAVEASFGRELMIDGLPQVKFLSPLLPAQRADIALEVRGERVQFVVRVGERVIAQGALDLRPSPSR